ncbi:MAG: T9SS type A sorting domain-containing protein [bacterium]
MKKLLTLCVLFLFAAVINAQVLLDENVDYAVGDSLTGHGWVAHSGTAATSTILAQSGNLSYANYPLSNIGNYVTIAGGAGSRQDVNKTFTEQTAGSVYAFVLVNVTSAATTGDYFMHFGPDPISTLFRGRVYVKDDGAGGLLFGLAKTSVNPVYTTTATTYNTTHLLVLEYKLMSGSTNDDSVKLYIDPNLSLPQGAPSLVNVDVSTATTDINVGCFALRQGGQVYSMLVDGIRISTSWIDLVPVELTSFSAVNNGNNVNVSWSTATETNNNGFELFRNNQKITFVNGNGTTTERKSYSYIDENLASGKYNYQLFQIDYDGTRSLVAKTDVEVSSVPNNFSLSQNYPNPFNPTTTIKFALPTTSNVKLTIYNTIGKEIAVLVNGSMEAGNHNVNWNAGNNTSGMYFFKLEAGNFTATKKMMLIK